MLFAENNCKKHEKGVSCSKLTPYYIIAKRRERVLCFALRITVCHEKGLPTGQQPHSCYRLYK